MVNTLNTAHFCSGGGTTFEYLASKANRGKLGNICSKVMVASQDNIGALEKAQELGVAIEILKNSNDSQEMIDIFQRHSIDNVCLNGYLPLYPQKAVDYILEEKQGVSLNQHPGIVRRNHKDFGGKGMKGRRPTAARVMQLIAQGKHGDDVFTESTVQYVGSQFDTGEVVGIEKLDFQHALKGFKEAGGEMLSRVITEPSLLVDTLALGISSFSQDIQGRLLDLEYKNTAKVMRQLGTGKPLRTVPEYDEALFGEEDEQILEASKKAAIKLFPDD